MPSTNANGAETPVPPSPLWSDLGLVPSDHWGDEQKGTGRGFGQDHGAGACDPWAQEHGDKYDRMGGLGSKLRRVDFTKESLPPVKKDLYDEVDSVSRRNPEEVQKWLSRNDITISGGGFRNPILTFDETPFPRWIDTEIHKAFSGSPTLIQSVAWPLALSGFDVIGIAETGSGKTLAFVLPAFVHVLEQPSPHTSPRALIVAPTRELAVQIHDQCLAFGRDRVVQQLLARPDLVVCTPGRMIDLLEAEVTSMRLVSYLVLDEADRMLDMGFERQLRQIVGCVRPDRQTLMWSATWPKDVRQIGRDFLRAPVLVTIGGLDARANPDIRQRIHFCEDRQKPSWLMGLFRDSILRRKVLIFVETKRGCDQLARELTQERLDAHSLHGDKAQCDRDRTLRQFREDPHGILVATDVAARGLDIRDIEVVVNYDFPATIEVYVHRIGRTGRVGAAGEAHSLFTPRSHSLARGLLTILEGAGQPVPAELTQLTQDGRRKWSDGVGKADRREGQERRRYRPY